MKKLLTILSLTFLLALPHLATAAIINVPTNFLALNTGLVGWWTMDGKDTNWTTATAGTVADMSGNGNTGTLTNMNQATAPVPGKIGQALKFDGVNSYVSVPSNSALNPSVISISFWVYLPAAPASNNYSFFEGNGGGSNNRIRPGGGVGGGLQWLTNGTTNNLSSNGAIPIGAWSHWVFVGSGSGLQIYKNGILDNSNATGYSKAADGIVGLGGNWALGFQAPNCYMDDFRIYSRALSATEVSQLYNASAGSKVSVSQTGPGNLNSGLVGWWTMDGKDTNWTTATAGTVADMSGNGNTGTLTNMNQATAPVPGKLGQALKFDGVDDYVAINAVASIPVYSTTNPYTISFWVKGQNRLDFTVVYGESTSAGGQDNVGIRFLRTNNVSRKLRVAIVGNGPTSVLDANATTDVFNGAWHHIVWTDSAGSAKLYIDGIQDATDFTYIPQATTLNLATVGAWRNSPNPNGEWFFNDPIDDVRLYNRALTAAEVSQLYNSTAGSKVSVSQTGPGNLNTGLVGWWTMDGKDTNWTTATAGTVADMSGNGNTGTLTNMNQATSPVAGKTGQALQFNRSNNQQVNLPLTINSFPLTISAWIKPQRMGYIVSGVIFGGLSVDLLLYDFHDANESWFMIYEPASGYISSAYGTGEHFNEWQHVVAVIGAGGTNATIYWDGQVIAGPTDIPDVINTGNTTYIGNDYLSSNFNGTIDDVRVYNRALSAGEVTKLYNMGR